MKNLAHPCLLLVATGVDDVTDRVLVSARQGRDKRRDLDASAVVALRVLGLNFRLVREPDNAG